ncbi:MAG: preprotein translocase subunit SecA [Peptococcaceae bacterium]|nr:preprotein translocase subunit SecA [Peptococcaceae bacterium]
MLGFIRNFLDDNARQVKKMTRVVERINDLEAEISSLSDEALQAKTAYFRDKLANGTSLDDILPEAFAVVRETSKRVLGMRHFDVQLIGGITLHHGLIAEMKTGEGKTLVATLPAYLNALTGQGVHVITVNDYLARRDSEWMGQIYKFLGLSVGLIVHGLDWEEKRTAYLSDIVYGTNNEFGFDYLRDNMAVHPDQLVQRKLNYAIVDEVDSILIDEARTPLIISGQADKATDLYYTFAKLVPKMQSDLDFLVDEKAHSVTVTEEGSGKVEKMLGISNLFDDSNIELNHHLIQALKAYSLMKRDRDYVVKDGQVIIVDEFTGRLMFGRRYSDGLHQSIEAKEGVKIEKESQTLATITFQNYFRMYKKLAGMTGTAATEEDEFRNIYNLDVIVIPTHMPMVRKDLPDVVFKTEMAKFRAAIQEIVLRHKEGQPVLVGTISIEKSEVISEMLKIQGVSHKVLNAKHHDKEAEIIAQAGQYGAVTIATNMAGRGTDILLGGNPVTDENRNKVVEQGGLHIIGTERHESRRIDNQLRGRSGRQGDPGSTQFFSSLEDDLMRLFGSDNISGLMDKLGIDEDMPIEHGLITKSIETAQKRVENRNFEIRKHVLQYDDVMNQQRELIYSQRNQILTGEDLKDTISSMIQEVIAQGVATYCPNGVHQEEWDLDSLLSYGEQVFLHGRKVSREDIEDLEREEINEHLLQEALEAYDAREAELGLEVMREIERMVTLKIVDEKWMDHLDAMDQLREGIGLRAYGQKDPLVEYKFEGYEMFQNMISSIQEDVVKHIFRVSIVTEDNQPRQKNLVENRYQEEGSKQPVRKDDKVGRNDICTCGSGKKYKKCCGKNQQL